MRNSQLAEFILGLFTSRERAASAVGDLMENTPERGALWFWSNVLGTALSLLWRDFAAEPSFMAGLALRGILVNVSLLLVLFGGIVVLSVPFVFLAIAVGGAGLVYSPALLAMCGLAGWIGALAVEFQTGRWIARRAHGREIAACIAFLAVDAVAMNILGEVLFREVLVAYAQRHAATPEATTSSTSFFVIQLLSAASLVVGAISVRIRRTEAATRY